MSVSNETLYEILEKQGPMTANEIGTQIGEPGLQIAYKLRKLPIFKQNKPGTNINEYSLEPFDNEDLPTVQFKQDIKPYALAYLQKYGPSTTQQMFQYGMEHGLFGGGVNIDPNRISSYIKFSDKIGRKRVNGKPTIFYIKTEGVEVSDKHY